MTIIQVNREMTTRELYTDILNGRELTSEHLAKVEKLLAKLDKERKPSKADLEKRAINDGIKAEILDLLTAEGAMIAPDIATKLSTDERPISPNKAGALCRQMVTDEVLTVSDVRIPKRGTLKQYAVAEGKGE